MTSEPSGAEMSEFEDEGGDYGTHMTMEGEKMMEEEMGMEESEKSDSVTGMSAADKKRHKIEYLQLLKEIEGQNKIVDQLKFQLIASCESPCLTKCELREIKKLRGCLENENLKLQCMIQRAIKMQNENPSKCWDEIPIVTSLEDDVFPLMGNSTVMQSLGLMPTDKSEDGKEVCDVCSKKRKKKAPCPCSKDEDSSLDTQTCQLFEEMAVKDKMIDCLNERLKLLKKELCIITRKKKREEKKTERTLEEDIANIQNTVDSLNNELRNLCKEKQKKQKTTSEPPRHPNELKKLKEDFAQLLCKYQKKEEQLKSLEGRVKGYAGGCGNIGGTENVDYAELKMLREKVSDLRDEQEEYTCIIKEQAENLDDYRKKYLDAQQKVEEQKCMLEKIDMNNKRIEGQIEAEVKRIKAKFKEQLSELSQYPKLLENEQIKLASACKDREELEAKLRLVCKELKSAKEIVSKTQKEGKPDCSTLLAKCENELALLQHQMEELTKEKELVCEELFKAKQDLDTMRAESAKIITTTKERFEMTKTSMGARIDTLEKELAQCRANAYLSITDREAVIKEMQSQLSTLSYSFDSAQKQIKTLKNHITFLSNDQCIPIKC